MVIERRESVAEKQRESSKADPGANVSEPGDSRVEV